MEKNQYLVLKYLCDLSETSQDEVTATGKVISEVTTLTPFQVNEAVESLNAYGLVERLQTFGTTPYYFYSTKITQRGKYEFRREKAAKETRKTTKTNQGLATTGHSDTVSILSKVKPPAPIGSPYGFTYFDWEAVASRRADKGTLYVVFGLKFESEAYVRLDLERNIKNMFEHALQQYNEANAGAHIALMFIPLHAGYGEHLFNEIARDIICSDVAVFETSDMAPNVFIEIGMALTWDSKVFLIKKEGSQPPPSDISGQTYADYRDNGKTFVDTGHQEKLYQMVERAIRKKG